ncbi:MAG: hypothetical protein ACRECH_02175 [Nitrososphaerales archaeon]
MGSISKGIKAGLAAGVVYAALIGLLHTGFLTICAPYQIAYIQSQTAGLNPTTVITTSLTTITTTVTFPSAQDIFNTDLVVFSLDWAVGALVAGVIYGAIFGAFYERLPGSTSKKKGLYLSIFVFILGIVLGLSGWELGCSPDYYHAIPVLASVPISAAFGYLLGMLYDSFGAVEREEQEIAKRKEAEREDEKKRNS